MQNNISKYQQTVITPNVGFTAEHINMLTEENEKLVLANAQLKKKLQDEQLLHTNLYKEWKVLKANEIGGETKVKRYKKTSKWVTSPYVFYSLLAITFFLAVPLLYNLLVNHKENKPLTIAVASPVVNDTSINIISKNQQPTDTKPLEQKAIENKKYTLTKTPTIIAEAKALNNSSLAAIESAAPILSNTNEGLYKVKAKAYLYNAPDSSTRRNAFIVHWNNSYATLKALDEKAGFVYVVFTNHKGQTSKGWLRKLDLFPAQENSPY